MPEQEFLTADQMLRVRALELAVECAKGGAILGSSVFGTTAEFYGFLTGGPL